MKKIAKQIVFGGREPQLFAFAGYEPAFEIDFRIGEIGHLAGIRGGPPQHRANAGHQFARAERLHHVIVGADLEQEHFIEFVSQGAEHDDGRRHLGGAQLLANIRTGHARQT